MEQLLRDFGWLIGYVAAPLLVVCATWLQRWLIEKHPERALSLGGTLASLPFVIGPLLLYTAVNVVDGPVETLAERRQLAAANAAESARSALWGMLAYLAFCATCALVADGFSRRHERFRATLLTLLTGVAGFILVALLLRLNPLQSSLIATPLVLASIFAFRRLLPRLGCDGRKAPHLSLALEASAKGVLAALLCAAAIWLRRNHGNSWGGIAGIFPTATGVMLFGCMYTAGPAGLRHQLLGIVRGALGLLVFLLCFTHGVRHLPPLLLTGLAFAAAALCAWVVGRLLPSPFPQIPPQGQEDTRDQSREPVALSGGK